MKKYLDIILRYSILVLIAILGFDIFYFIFLPLTKYSVYYLLNIFFEPIMLGNSIFIGLDTIEIIGACVAGSAYFFLLILNLSTPDIKINKRLSMIVTAFFAFLIINILRIFFLSLMYINDSPLFDITHKLFWYLGSTLLVIVIWFAQVKLYRIKNIPFYSDIKSIYRQSSFKK
jgi:exosortase/archaeosortase family protein